MSRLFALVIFICGAELVTGQSNRSAPLLLSGGPNQKLIQILDTTNNQTNFQVMGDGRLFARELEITIKNFPDYVFDPNYPLRSLDSLKSYILIHRHLPELPSANELVAQNDAVKVSEMLKLQMAKIEELTLYILQLQDRIKKLEEQK